MVSAVMSSLVGTALHVERIAAIMSISFFAVGVGKVVIVIFVVAAVVCTTAACSGPIC